MISAHDLLPPEIAESETDLYVEGMAEFEEAAQELELEPWMVDRVKNSEREVTVNLAPAGVGEHSSVTGYRVLHNSVRGPGLGPVYIAADMSLNRVRAAAMKATWQSALLDLPFGGSAGALVCGPEGLSEAELRWVVQAYMEKLGGMVGRFSDVVVPEARGNCRIATWMMDACARHAALPDFAAVTGKPAAVWGLSIHAGAATAAVALLGEIVGGRGGGLNHQTVVIQGFGHLGAAIAKLLHSSGARVVGLADVSGAFYREDGVNVPEVESYFQRNQILYGYPEADAVCNADLLEAPADILVLAAAENQITRTNAEHVRASIVLEIAENAVSAKGSEVLNQRGILVVPELVANGGAVVAAFLEWTQGFRFSRFSETEIQQTLKMRMAGCWRELGQFSGGDRDVRAKALRLAISRVAETMRALA